MSLFAGSMDWRCRKFKGSWKFWNLEMVCRQVSCNEFFNLYFVIWSISLPGLMFWRNINHVYYLFMQKLLHLCAFVSISWSVLCPAEVYLIQGRRITCDALCLDPSIILKKMTYQCTQLLMSLSKYIFSMFIEKYEEIMRLYNPWNNWSCLHIPCHDMMHCWYFILNQLWAEQHQSNLITQSFSLKINFLAFAKLKDQQHWKKEFC